MSKKNVSLCMFLHCINSVAKDYKNTIGILWYVHEIPFDNNDITFQNIIISAQITDGKVYKLCMNIIVTVHMYRICQQKVT